MKKNILITGSTDGIGKLLAFRLAKEGHTLYLHGRSEVKLKSVIFELKAAAKNENIFGFVADFSDLDSVRKMAEQVNRKVEKLDILINNAGIFKSSVSKTTAGIDIRLAVNYLAPYLLTRNLLPLLKKGSEPRLINLSSAAQSPVSLAAIAGKEQLNVSEAYAQSKLALTMWSFQLANQQKDIAVIAVNPGSLLNTKMANEAYGQHWSPADKGSNILYDLALSAKHKDSTGQYFDNDQGSYSKAHPDAYNQEKIENLITKTNEVLR